MTALSREPGDSGPRGDSGPPERPAESWLHTRTEILTEHRQVVAAEIARHLGNVESEVRRHREILAHYDHVFDLRLTAATSDTPATATEGPPA